MNITKLKSIAAAALCAVGLSAFAAKPEAVQLWEGGPYFATCNVGDGATVPGDYGALYTFADNKAADAAKSLGDGWRLPSNDELNELRSKCTKKWETCKDSKGANINGYRFTGKGDYSSNSIFLPAAGCDGDDGREYDGEDGYYWSSTERPSGGVWCLEFREQDPKQEDPCYMNYSLSSDGMSVRAVRDTPPTPTPPEPPDEEVVATAEATFVLGPALAVANVTTATHWPWDGKIDVTCDLTGSGKVQLSAALTTNGVTVCTAAAENLTGETEIDLDQVGGATNGVKFVWNAKADCPAGFNSTDTKVKVTAKKVVPPAGALPGEFSVSADKKVLFSQGNLVATIDVSGVPTAWKFAANQYDYVGKSGANEGIGSKAGDVDLFGWSTSSNGGTSTTDNYGIKMSKDDADYSGSFYDWGKAVGDGSTWRTLSVEEWKYLIEAREVNGGKGEGKSFQRATINSDATSVFGMILYPDNYTETAKASYTSAEWTSLEKLGCVFLPAAGYRWSVYSMVMYDGASGYYWSKSEKDDANAYFLNFRSGSMRSDTSGTRSDGYSVRLVTEVK